MRVIRLSVARRLAGLLAAVALASLACSGGPAPATNPAGGTGGGGSTAVMAPLNDLGAGSYLGFGGGLYPGGANVPPNDHHQAGLAMARMVQPLLPNGATSPGGKYVLLSVGMSNTTQEFCAPNADTGCNAWSFMGQAAADPDVNRTHLVIVNGARGGQTAGTWEDPAMENYDRIRDGRLLPQGLSELQVQVVWVKVANARPASSLPAANADALQLLASQGRILRALRARYPNLKLVFFSSRIYAGYATTDLNPEPYAYESGFGVKWLIEAQIQQMRNNGIITDPRPGDLDYNTVAAWAAWGPYLWARGLELRSDGLNWLPGDFAEDGTHPSPAGQQKVGTLLLRFFKESPYTRCWFTTGGVCQ
jgi:hypothetical protein